MRLSRARINPRQLLYGIITIEVIVLMMLRPAEMFLISMVALGLRGLWPGLRRLAGRVRPQAATGGRSRHKLGYLHRRILYPSPSYHIYAQDRIIAVQSGYWVVLLGLWLATGWTFASVYAGETWTPITRTPLILVLTWATLGLFGLMVALVERPTDNSALWERLQHFYTEFRQPRQHLLDGFNWRLVLLFGVELALISTVAYAATALYRYPDDAFQLSGTEAEWLTSSAYQSYYALQRDGYIPEWNPWFEYGSPNIINPFSFVTNAISMWPPLIIGGERGILFGVLLYAVLAGIGGWFLGRVLGLSSVGRVSLGLLMIGKGNIHAMLGAGHYQLGISQAYIPWVVAGFVATVYYPTKRWPPVLTGVAFALQFMAGNIWYTLPTLLTMGALAVAHLLVVNRRLVDLRVVRGWTVAAIVTIIVAAATLIPIWHYRDLVLHPVYDPVKEIRPVDRVAETLWESEVAPYFNGQSIGYYMVYYSYTAPAWLLLLIFLYLPPIWPFLYRAAHHDLWRIWAVGVVMTVFGILWGAGDNHVIKWLYEEVEVLAQFRFKGRALGIASFWLAVLVALRLDGLVRALYSPVFWRTPRRMVFFFGPQAALLAYLAFRTLVPSADSSNYIGKFGWAEPPRVLDYGCAAWLRDHYPDEPLAVYRIKYDATTAYIVHEVRMMPIEADYTPLPMPNTIGSPTLNLTLSYPRWGVATDEPERTAIRSIGYVMVEESPTMAAISPQIPDNENHCLFERTKYYPYAYTVPLHAYDNKRYQKPEPTLARPVTVIERLSDTVTLHVEPVPTTMIVQAQELAYPGWQAYVDGERVDLEVFGGFVAVVIPPDGRAHTVEFRYHNVLYHRTATASAIGCTLLALYLLRADRWVVWLWRRRAARA